LLACSPTFAAHIFDMPVTIGQPAPLFSLYDSQKKKVNLADMRGQNVLLLFFPLAFTSTCTKELCSVRDSIGYYNSVKAQVFGISVDSLYTLNKYREEQNLNFPLLSDFNKEVSASYDCLYPLFGFDMRGVSKRAAFIVDAAGMIRYAEVLENAGEIPDFAKINEVLSSLA
jgi:glutaredoxin-dependent peroxiredoxin